MIGALSLIVAGTGLSRALAVPAPQADPKPPAAEAAPRKAGAGVGGAAPLASFDTFRAVLSAENDEEEDAQGLTKEERKEVAELKDRDREVRRHEQAHANAGGQFAGSPSYTFERGPDGRSYAVGGTTPIDVSPVSGDPQATVRKMQVVKRAALAPADPSPQDRRIAAQAEAQRLKAQAEAARGDDDEAAESGRPDPLRPAISLEDFIETRRADEPTRSEAFPRFGRTPSLAAAASGTAPRQSGANLVSLLA